MLIVVLGFVLMVIDPRSPPPEQWCAEVEMAGRWVRGLLDRARGGADGRGRGHNALALAAHVLDTVVGLGGPAFEPTPDPDDSPWQFASVVRAAFAVWRSGPGEAPDIIDRVLRYWEPMTKIRPQFVGVLASARVSCGAVAEPGLAATVYFGCEPASPGADGLGRDFACAVSRQTPGALSLPAALSGDATLVGKALKALYFEAVFNDPDRRSGRADTPLGAYVADEFHRFATSDPVHGEQSFLDASRSFAVACVLACQSLASSSLRLRSAAGATCRIGPRSGLCGTTPARSSFSDRPIPERRIASTTSLRGGRV